VQISVKNGQLLTKMSYFPADAYVLFSDGKELQ